MHDTIITRIGVNRSWWNIISEFWEFRGLLYWLAWRDVKLRYAQTYAGVFWALLQPVAMMLITTMVFGLFIRVPSKGLPYGLFVLSGLIMWTFFTSIVNQVSYSLISNGAVISKIYFPRLIVPFTASIPPCFDFGVALLFLITLSCTFGIFPTLSFTYVGIFILMTYLLALGCGLWFAALNVRYRDVQFCIPIILQVGMYASPVMYPLEIIPQKLQHIYAYNPFVTILEGFRHAVFNTDFPLASNVILIAILIVLTIFFTGLLYFQSIERTLIDRL